MIGALYFLDEDDVLIVNRTLAKAIGLNRSIALRQIRYWLKLNEKVKSEKHFHAGSWWTFNTYTDWQRDNFDFWSWDTVTRTLTSLENEFALIKSTSEFNKKEYDHTKWYTIHYGNYAAFMRLWQDFAHPRAGDSRYSNEYTLFMEQWGKQRAEYTYSVAPTDEIVSGERPQLAESVRNLPPPIPETTQTLKKKESAPAKANAGASTKTPKKERAADPLFDAVSMLIFGIDSKMIPVKSRSNVAAAAHWLAGKTEGTKAIHVGKLTPAATPEEVRAFVNWYSNQTGGALNPTHISSLSMWFWKFRTAQSARVIQVAPAAPAQQISVPVSRVDDYMPLDDRGMWIGSDDDSK